MKLLELSIWEDGYTMPCVCYYLPETDQYELVDGFHRYKVMLTSPRIYEREKGLLPVVVIDKDISNRMASTIRHNRARGTHCVELMCKIVSELTEAGTPWPMFRLSMSVCGSSPKRLNCISRSWALSLIWVSFTPSHSVVTLSVQANTASVSSVADACFCEELQPAPHSEATSILESRNILFLIIV